MRKVFTPILVTMMLLILSSNSLFANSFSQSLLGMIAQKTALNSFYTPHLSQDDFNFYSTTFPIQEEYLTKCIISDNSEEDVEQLNSKKNIPLFKGVGCHFKQQLLSITTHIQSRASFCIPVFFQLKKYTSLYLLFEVFRI